MSEAKVVGIVTGMFAIGFAFYAATLVLELIECGYITYDLKGGREAKLTKQAAFSVIFGVAAMAALFAYVGIAKYKEDE